MSSDDAVVEWRLSGFGDEIDPDPRVQCAVLSALGARHIEVRSAWDTNIVEMHAERLRVLHEIIEEAGMGVSAIASPVGKSRLSEPIDVEAARLDRAVRAAHELGAPFIRIFSFWRCEDDGADARDLVVERLGVLAERATAEGLVLVHENEKDIYGDTPDRVLDLVAAVDSPGLRVAWDSANYVQVGAQPHTDGFAKLAPYVAYLQVKDARASDGAVVAAGEGDGEVEETVRALVERGYAGFASLEPHLGVAHAFGGFTGPFDYGRAARAFRTIAERSGVVLT